MPRTRTKTDERSIRAHFIGSFGEKGDRMKAALCAAAAAYSNDFVIFGLTDFSHACRRFLSLRPTVCRQRATHRPAGAVSGVWQLAGDRPIHRHSARHLCLMSVWSRLL